MRPQRRGLTQVPAAPPVAPAAKGPKIGALDEFDSTCGVKAKVFLNQVNLYMLAKQALFTTNRAQMVFILSYLSGPASSWAQPWMQKVMIPNKDVKKADFAAMHCNTKKKAKAEEALPALKQTKLVAHYTHQFNLHGHNASWEAPTLISQYIHGLKTQIHVVLLMAWTEFTKSSEVANPSLLSRSTMNSTVSPQLRHCQPLTPMQ